MLWKMVAASVDEVPVREGGEKIPVVVKNDLFKSHVFEKTFEVFCKFHLTRS